MRKGVVCQEKRIFAAAWSHFHFPSFYFESNQGHYDGRLSGLIGQSEMEQVENESTPGYGSLFKGLANIFIIF